MNSWFLLAAVLSPFLGGFGLLVHPARTRRGRDTYVFWLCLANSLLVGALLIFRPGPVTLLSFGGQISLTLHLDGLSFVFAAILAILWPITNLYAFEYMIHLEGENRFFAFFTMTYGVVLGIAFAANTFTLYLFYELLTLCTLPLVMHELEGTARYAGKKYLLYSMAGAALAFLSMVVLYQFGSLDYRAGGSLDPDLASGRHTLVLIGFVLGFFGFGVKAAVWPLHGWLPTAGVAPTPVTALLHAVAVVNAGVFAILRLIYYSYGADFVRGSWAQDLVMAFTIVTLLFGSLFAWRMPHLKRRLAYSTVGNLSYILFAASLMSTGGLTAALAHMTVHSVLKITLFFCAGSILCQHHHKGYIWQYEGLGRKMPVTCAAFALASVGLMGVPPLPGFFSKWMIAERAALTGNPLAWLGAFALVVSAFLTGLYLIQVLIVLYFPTRQADLSGVEEVTEAGWPIRTALILLCVLAVCMGLFFTDLSRLLSLCAGGLL